MESNPIKVMYDEHFIIKKSEKIINSIDCLWEKDASRYIEIVTQLIDFFRNYSDGYHHHKEEGILFPAIKNHPDFVLQEMIDEFNEHHNSFREYTKDIVEALDNNEFPKSYNLMQEYFNDLLDHIAAEDEELFVLAETLLSDNELETMYFKFKDVDMELGEERKKTYEQMIDTLGI